MSAARASVTAKSDRNRVMITPEGIALPVTVGSRGSRFGALALDLLFIVVLMISSTLLLAYLGSGVDELRSEALAKGDRGIARASEFLVVLWIAVMFLFRHAYFLFFELGPRGATPGKRLTGLRIAARDGGRLTTEMVLARNLLRDIELFLPIAMIVTNSGADNMGAAGLAATVWFLVFGLFPFFNRDRLRAGDLVAGTWVVEAPRRKLEAVLSTTPTAASGHSAATGAQYRFGEAELAIYGEFELQTLERVLREDRPEALVAVHTAICRKIGWEPGAGDERAFLEAYYTQLRARLESGLRLGQRKADKHG